MLYTNTPVTTTITTTRIATTTIIVFAAGTCNNGLVTITKYMPSGNAIGGFEYMRYDIVSCNSFMFLNT